MSSKNKKFGVYKMKAMLNIEDGMTIENIDVNFNGTLDRLNYLNRVISNLKMRDVVNIMDVAEIDERLIKEITNYEMLTEEMKVDAVLLLVNDAVRLQEACFKNNRNLSKGFESLRKIEDLLNTLLKNNGSTKTSIALQKLITEAKSKLNKIMENMDGIATEIKNQQKQTALQAKMRRYSG